MKISELMTRRFHAVREETPIREFVRALCESNASGLPVVDSEGQVVGFISERDVIEAALPGYLDLLESDAFWPEVEKFSGRLQEIAREPVREYMVCEVVKVREDEDELYVAELMIRKGLKVIPVVDREGALIGLVRRIDLLTGIIE
jgi:CBS domain-containing protein